MTDSPDYRLYLQQCFNSVNGKFTELEQSLNRIEKHLEKQNSSITELQTESNKRLVVVEDFRNLEKDFNSFVEKEFECVKTKVDNIDKDLLEVWFFKKYPKIFIGIITVAVFATLGLSLLNKKDNREMRTKINWIEAYEKIPFSPVRGAVTARPDTIKKD